MKYVIDNGLVYSMTNGKFETYLEALVAGRPVRAGELGSLVGYAHDVARLTPGHARDQLARLRVARRDAQGRMLSSKEWR